MIKIVKKTKPKADPAPVAPNPVPAPVVAPAVDTAKAELPVAVDAVDELADLLLWYDSQRGKLKRIEELKKTVSARVKELATDPTKEFVMQGELYEVTYSACGTERYIEDIAGLHKAMAALGRGDEFYAMAKIGITDADKYLSPTLKEQYLKSRQGSSRSVGTARRRPDRPDPSAL